MVTGSRRWLGVLGCAAVVALGAGPLEAQNRVWRCPGTGSVPVFQNAPGTGCTPMDLPPLNVIPSPRGMPTGTPRPAGTAPGREAEVPSAAAAFPRVERSVQKTRDDGRRAILEGELKREQQRMDSLKQEFNGGEPERLGDERNFQKYLDRVERLKNDVARSEASVDAIRRELDTLQ